MGASLIYLNQGSENPMPLPPPKKGQKIAIFGLRRAIFFYVFYHLSKIFINLLISEIAHDNPR